MKEFLKKISYSRNRASWIKKLEEDNRLVIAIHIHHWHNEEVHVPQKTGIQLFFLVELGYLHMKPDDTSRAHRHIPLDIVALFTELLCCLPSSALP
ncbi:hypothetical protein LEMLEM_LOCUS6386 [Lemmus lemmus]